MFKAHVFVLSIVLLYQRMYASRLVDAFDFRSASGVNSEHVPTVSSPATLRAVAESLATDERQIILTTFQVSPDGPLEQIRELVRNFAQSLSVQGLLHHSLLVATDLFSARFVLEEGIPCVVDNVMPTLFADMSNGVIKEGFYPNVSKWLWTEQLLSLDMTVMYMDWDVSVVQNPFTHLDNTYDIQGLSDFHNAPKHTGKLQIAFHDTGHTVSKLHPAICPLYGDALTPCQSTGVSFIKAGALTLRFVQEFVRELLANTPGWWEQSAYNEFVPAWTMGTGMQPPLRYRLLPYRQYMNVGIWHELRQQSNATEDLIVLHGGYVPFHAKASAFAETGSFDAVSWKSDSGKSVVEQLLAVTGN